MSGVETEFVENIDIVDQVRFTTGRHTIRTWAEEKPFFMNSFATMRPPKVPKQVQPLPTVGSTVTDTFDNHQQDVEYCSHHRHRSSSQPRASQPADPLPLASNSITSRSASQPRALQNAHFLDGFNVADCFDVRAIPDPPSPCNTKSRHRRRVSSAVLRPMSSRDITNRGNYQSTIASDAIGADTKSSSSVRRKRKTLSHVPSPIIPAEEQQVGSNAIGSSCDKPPHDVEVKAKILHINLCHDDDSYELARDCPKRRKKRQSMVIPSDLPCEEHTDTPPNVPSLKHSQNSSKTSKAFFPGDFKSMQKLRNLVRGYCALSSKGERGASNEGKEIQVLTGYALPRRITTDDVSDKSQAILCNRRLVIQKIAPVLAQMEKRKDRDVKQWERTTGCYVTKSERSGRYRYYDIESNQRVGSHEYKRRYISYLEHSRHDRLAKAHTWMNKLNPVDRDNHPDYFLLREDSISIDQQACNHIGYSSMEQKEAFSPPRNNYAKHVESIDVGRTDPMDICDMNMSLDYGEQQSSDISTRNINCHAGTTTTTAMTTASDFERSEIAEISEASSEDTDDNPQESRSSSPTIDSFPDELTSTIVVDGAIIGAVGNFGTGEPIVREARDDDGSPKMDEGRKDDTDTVPLLPFPSRDTESVDPEIAAAERRLWDKIDLALHEYSGEVINIEEKKRLTGGHRLVGEQKVT